MDEFFVVLQLTFYLLLMTSVTLFMSLTTDNPCRFLQIVAETCSSVLYLIVNSTLS
jgi:hypothetical protein